MTRIIKKVLTVLVLLVVSFTLLACNSKPEHIPEERIVRHIYQSEFEEISIFGGEKALIITIYIRERKFIDDKLVYDITYTVDAVWDDLELKE